MFDFLHRPIANTKTPPNAPDHAYVIPANTSLSIKNGMLQLGSRVVTHGQHMPINDFFRSLAESAGQQAIGVILSGTASDGTEGCGAIKAAGGITFAQDEESAKYDSMPRNAVNAGYIDFILSPKDIARELGGISQHPYVARVVSSAMETVEGMEGSDLNALFGLLQESTGVDFTHYKHTTLQRRIRRRMVVHKVENLKDYLRFIGRKPEELDALYRDLLIHVTGFFREPEAFVALRKHVYPKLFEGRKPDNPYESGWRAARLAKKRTRSRSRCWNTCGCIAGTFRRPRLRSRSLPLTSATRRSTAPAPACTPKRPWRKFLPNA